MKNFLLAVTSSGFAKALGYSVGSTALSVVILYLSDPALALVFGKYALLVPSINLLAVGLKQYFDERKKGLKLPE